MPRSLFPASFRLVMVKSYLFCESSKSLPLLFRTSEIRAVVQELNFFRDPEVYSEYRECSTRTELDTEKCPLHTMAMQYGGRVSNAKADESQSRENRRHLERGCGGVSRNREFKTEFTRRSTELLSNGNPLPPSHSLRRLPPALLPFTDLIKRIASQ